MRKIVSFASRSNCPPSQRKQQVHSLRNRAFVIFTACPSFSSLPDTSQKKADLPLPSNNFRGIAKSVISKCSYLWVNHSNIVKSLVGLPLQDYFLRLSNISPQTVRRFWRVSVLSPQDVLHIFLGFEFDNGKFEIEREKVESLWGVFQWASEQCGDFQHLTLSCKIMAKLLVRVGMFGEAQCVLSRLDGEGILLDCHEIFSDLIEGYVMECDLERATLNYNRTRKLGLSPSFSCYRSLLDSFVQMNEVQLAYAAFLDMVELGMARSAAEHGIYQNVVRLLCMDGKVQEARYLVKKNYDLGIKPNRLVLDAIVSGYCEKMDYDDIPNFLVEIKGLPDVAVGNKVIWSLSRSFGSERANVFMQELEQLGFCPNKMTFGILIGQTCSEGSLKNGFILLSEMLSRNLKPDIYTCNALMSALFKEGLWKESLDILLEMKDWGTTPNLSTFRILLAGALKARQIGEVRAIVGLMEDHGLIQLPSPENHLSTALALMGLNPLTVKVRRDNDAQFSKTQFFDDLGNGLYLETDLDDFEKALVKVLDDAMFPDFNSTILKYCSTKGDIIIALQMADEIAAWGQVLSASAASTLVNKLSTSQMNLKELNSFLEKLPNSVYRLDQGALNMLVQKYCKRRCTHKAKMILDNMLRMKLEIENSTYSAVLISLCKKGNLRSFHQCWQLARESYWLPELKAGKALLGCLCQSKLLDEALELLETILMECHYQPLDASRAFIENLCCRGFTAVADVLVKELQERGLVLDDVVYNNLLSGFCKEKKFAEAFLLVDALVGKKFDPSLSACLQLIPQLCLAGNLDKAVLLKNRCLEKQPSTLRSLYYALIDGLCQMGMVGEAFKFFQEIMQSQMADDEVYNMLILGYCQVNDPRRLREVLGIMMRNDISLSISSYRSLVQQECAAGKFSDAWSLKAFMLGERSIPSIAVYNILMFYVSPMQGTGVTEKLIDEIHSKGLQLDAVTYNLIIEGSANPTDVSRSLWYLETMISEGFRPSNRSLRKVMSTLLRLGKVEKVLELNQEMESRGWIHGSVIQINIVEALLCNGKLQEAVKFLDRMISGGCVPEKVDYNNLIKRLCQHGELGKAVDLLDIMIRKGSILDSASFDYLIQGFCLSHKLNIALDYHSEMLYRNLTPNNNTWSILVRELSEVGRVEEAEGLLQLMVEKGYVPSKEMYSAVINRYRSENNLKKASLVLRAMQESGHEPDFETHWSLISNFSNPTKKQENGFMSRLLSGIGFAKKD